MFGLDYVTGPPIATLKGAGVTFVCRYFSEVNALTEIKLLTPEEAKLLSEAGIAIVSNFEWYGDRASEGFASGVADAKIADAQHKACGGPADRPIYFSVDFNTGATSAIIDYFKGVASVIGLERTGAYGGYACIKGLLDASAIKWAWQTYAWSAGQWDARAHLQQYQNGVDLDGHSVDYDRSMTVDFGQWVTPGGSMIPHDWHDNGTTLTAPNGHKAVRGFREWVLSHAWDPANQPLQEEEGRNPLEESNLSLGAGTQQVFTWTTLEWTPARGVFVAWTGPELLAIREENATLTTDVATLQAEIATLKAQPPTTIDTTALVTAINGIGDGIAPLIAVALVEAKKL